MPPHVLTYYDRKPYMVISIAVSGLEIQECLPSGSGALKALLFERGFLASIHEEVEEIVCWAEQPPGSDHTIFTQEVYLKDACSHRPKSSDPY